ncbi:prenyltransferase [Thalassolituus oleivorans]|uniref:prenyltransferase n=1 Tax=Thalassolituus oleivorans TaxID=187493 RepID=UPI0023F285CC|nr:prenyltransferase [Thalassolituus oleivorans]
MKTIVQTMRVPFLILPPMCVVVGVACAYRLGASISAVDVVLILLGALLAHISVNMLNEYQDYRSGLDNCTIRTPFSGGSGALPSQPEAANAVLLGAVATLAGVAAIGFWFALRVPEILPLGVLGGVIILTYTRQINRSPWICLIAPGLSFGLLMVLGTTLVLAERIDTATILAALVPFFLVNNLLLLNQFPDLEADAAHGRKHFPIQYGIAASVRMYRVLSFATAGVIVLAVGRGDWPLWSLLALLPWALTLVSAKGASEYGKTIGQQPQFMAMNVVATVLTPLVLGVTLILG